MTYAGALQIPDDLFGENKREQGYFLRIASYSNAAEEFISQCSKNAAASGVILAEKPENPSSDQTSACVDIIGTDFDASKACISRCLCSYLKSAAPLLGRLPENLEKALADIRSMGKNDSIIKNTFVKYMYWTKKYVYPSLRNAVSGRHPMILFQGQMSKYELLFLSALADSGYDAVAVETEGDPYYASIDPKGEYSSLLQVTGGTAFPAGYSVKGKPSASASAANPSPAVNPSPVRNIPPAVSAPTAAKIPPAPSAAPVQADKTIPQLCTNAWLSGEIFADICIPANQRGSDPSVIYNCFVRINGAENKTNYQNDVYQVYMSEKDKRNTLILDEAVEAPTNEEIAAVRRGNYRDIQSLITDMSKNFVHSSVILQKMMCRAFSEVITEFYEETPEIRKALNESVYLICWMKKYQQTLFSGWKPGNVSCVFVMNGCKSAREAFFIKMLAKLPTDVLILMPDLDRSCFLKDKALYERNFVNSLTVEKFPQEQSNVQIGTVAYYAERDLDTTMYRDTGIYRSFQFSSANSIVLKTMYEEISILWHQELKYRPNFSSSDSSVNLPVIMAKISGVKDKNLLAYWRDVISLITKDTMIICNKGLLEDTIGCESAVNMIKNGRLQKDVIKKSKSYKYDFLKEETQNYILEKIQSLLDKKIISGENGIQYKVISAALSMSNDLLRRIQNFDFTKTNPKIIYINTTENIISQEDSILFALLSQIGFDILLFIPTGYQSADKYYAPDTLVSHQIGEYMYDIQIPDLSKKLPSKNSLLGKLFNLK